MPSRVDAADEKHVSTGVSKAVKVAINSISPCDYTPKSEADALGDEFVPLSVIVDMSTEPEEDWKSLEAYLAGID